MVWYFYVYLGIAVFAFVLLLLSLFLGSIASADFDIHLPFGIDVDVGGPDSDIGIDHDGGGGPGPMSAPVILGFLTAFGSLGSILTYYKLPPALVPFISIGGGLIVSVLLYAMIAYMFHHFQADSTVSYKELVGQEATISVSIRDGREGQVVLFTDKRGRTLVPAISDEDIPENTKVKIDEVIGDSVRVSRKFKTGAPVSRRK